MCATMIRGTWPLALESQMLLVWHRSCAGTCDSRLVPYEAVFDERRLMMWDRVDSVAGAVVRRQLDWPWYMLEAVVFVGVLWLLNADKSGFPFWVGRVFRYGIVVWCVFVVACVCIAMMGSCAG